MENLGAAYWKFEHGLLEKAQLEHVLELTRLRNGPTRPRTARILHPTLEEDSWTPPEGDAQEQFIVGQWHIACDYGS